MRVERFSGYRERVGWVRYCAHAVQNEVEDREIRQEALMIRMGNIAS